MRNMEVPKNQKTPLEPLEPITPCDDKDLLIRYFKGEGQAFDAFFIKHIERVCGYFRKKGLNDEDAKDLSQIVFLKLHKEIKNYDPERPPLPWFFTIVHHTLVDFLRQQSLLKRIIDIEHYGKNSTFYIEDIEKYLETLSKDKRNLIYLRITEELSFKDISIKTGKTETSLRKTYERTVKELSLLVQEKECFYEKK